MDVFHNTSLDFVISGYIDMACDATRYFNLENSDPVNVWAKMCILGKDLAAWKGIILIIELC